VLLKWCNHAYDSVSFLNTCVCSRIRMFSQINWSASIVHPIRCNWGYHGFFRFSIEEKI